MWKLERFGFGFSTLILSALAVLGVSAAQAVPMLTIDVPGGDAPQDLFLDGTCTGPGVSCQGNGVQTWSLDNPPISFEEGGSELAVIKSWTATFQDGTDGGDPFVFTQITLVNTTGSTQQYVVEVVLPLSAATGYNNNSGSLNATLTDGQQLSDEAGVWAYVRQLDGGFNYMGKVDGTAELEKNLNPVPMEVTNQGGSDSQSTGFPPVAVGPATANQIAVRLAFELSHGDELSIGGFYTITPEPSTALLVGLGITGMAIVRRRR